jgi:hypothetical protein
VKDSNLRSHLTTDLQSVPFGHLGNCPDAFRPFHPLVAWSHPVVDEANRQTNKREGDCQRSKPTTGIEPVTYHLQGGCSAELSYVGMRPFPA